MTTQAELTSFLYAQNASFLADLYRRYRDDPGSVDPSWASIFGSLGPEAGEIIDEFTGPSWAPRRGDGNGTLPEADGMPAFPAEAQTPKSSARGTGAATPAGPGTGAMAAAAPEESTAIPPEQLRQATIDSIRALMLIRTYRVRGHLNAKLDPLKLEQRGPHPELDPRSYGFTDADWDRPIFTNNVLGFETATLRQIMQRLDETYCGSIGVEFMHIQDPDQKAWIQQRIENIHNRTDFTLEGRRAILQRLTAAESFERFLNLKYTGTKRFGLDGSESLVPGLEQILKRGGQLGLKEIVIGMPHRGRLNVLANVMGKPFAAIFSEFQGNPANPEDVQGSGDVKYHLGTSSDREFDGNSIHLSLTANPSHLEAVNPVVCGKVRAKQMQRGDYDRDEVLGVLLHGDASFAGQGIVGETLMLSELKGYRVGGTIHFIVNNQIGFTTTPQYSRSGPYPSEMAKAIQAPIFHVNGDDPEAVVHVCRIAIEFRQQFKKDVVVDMFCYRRFGHNEADEPAFTQPVMYKTIAQHPSVREVYAGRLIHQTLIGEDEPETFVREFHDKLEGEFEASNTYRPNQADWLGGAWSGLTIAKAGDRRGTTGVGEDFLKEVGHGLLQVPEGFTLNSKLVRQFKNKERMLETGKGIDWATAEALAFGTLVREGVPVRLSGQDSGRGTFSQRHAVVYDQETEERHVPLNALHPDQAVFEVHDSPLSEFGVLGFEYGVSLAEPWALVVWEAQFGDFANGAQVIIDQFISSGESKWLRMSGLVMLLPHGYEGQGPEHSSARLERFLQMSGEDNWQVVYPTTPANYFHVLRRQIHQNFRKPLVVMTPKSLLRHKDCVSDISLFTGDSSFHRVLHEDTQIGPPEEMRRVVLCAGKVFYDLKKERDERGLTDVTLVRLEQLYPFPDTALAEELKKHPKADIVWCQEEPRNMGAWYHVDRKIEALLHQIGHEARRPSYAGRAEAASPATGLLRRHNQEQAKLVDQALTIG
ncbi:MAG: 2-oxoglutarate dehydrogenase E1 component [Alphaproteobacteria bacterium]|jgi:2-oxoglutarate dehydrogenase E1 component|nr:2-oxoglutarate dehydrogenase E1 component [Alphaproteobacteria bacterium]